MLFNSMCTRMLDRKIFPRKTNRLTSPATPMYESREGSLAALLFLFRFLHAGASRLAAAPGLDTHNRREFKVAERVLFLPLFRRLARLDCKFMRRTVGGGLGSYMGLVCLGVLSLFGDCILEGIFWVV